MEFGDAGDEPRCNDGDNLILGLGKLGKGDSRALVGAVAVTLKFKGVFIGGLFGLLWLFEFIDE